ncbi:FAD dependent oxidoreductase-domain-containing protein [Aspergillus karnatakaensis]|uniref:NAD(P)/FAD-dependent oxidoreductase n=1 Tax=Aspergillus karnatakaensis TaxID=1810916 RepID=UPI003CCDF1C1
MVLSTIGQPAVSSPARDRFRGLVVATREAHYYYCWCSTSADGWTIVISPTQQLTPGLGCPSRSLPQYGNSSRLQDLDKYSIMSTSPDGIYEPGVIDPGLPVRSPTQPFWLSEPSKIAKLQSPWVSEADMIIVGSGMTAASLLRSLYARKPTLKIVAVEARDLCSGATGRNGGHCKVMSPGVWFEREHAYGTQEALRVMRFEHSHLDEMVKCAKENNIQCDLRLHEGVDVYHDEHTFGRAVRALEAMREHAPDLAARYTVYTDRKDLDARSCPKKSVGAIGMPSGSVWPYKFVTGLLEKYVQDHGLNIQTNTVVTAVEESPDKATVKTTRGDISAPILVHATNAWMSHLVSELQPFVSPVRANVQRHLPDTITRVDNSLWFRYAEHDYDYMVQRHDGAFIIGRANTGRRATSDDGNMDVLPQTHLRTVVPSIFDFKTKNVQVTHAWSGCVAFTQDGNPFIGKWPGANRKHQYVSGGYSGIGMVRAFRSAQALAVMILGEEVPEEFPRSMFITAERLRKLDRAVKAKL